MTNKTITLSRDAAERMVSCAESYVDIDDADLIGLRAALADPVPPAGGEVEVKRGILIDEGYGEIWMDWGADSCMDRNEGPYVLASDFDKHVTQLQAELTSAIADKNAFAQNAVALRAEVGRLKQENGLAALKSELTKARELLEIGHISNTPGWREAVATYLSNQSAPVKMCNCNQGRLPCECK